MVNNLVGADAVCAALGLPEIKINSSLDSGEIVSSYGIVTTGKYDFPSALVDALTISPGHKGFVSNFAFEMSKHRCYERELDGLTSKIAY